MGKKIKVWVSIIISLVIMGASIGLGYLIAVPLIDATTVVEEKEDKPEDKQTASDQPVTSQENLTGFVSDARDKIRTGVITDRRLGKAIEWLSSWGKDLGDSIYNLEEDKVTIDDWVFTYNEYNEIDKYRTSKELSDEDIEKLGQVYEWGEVVKSDAGYYEWIKPSINCARHTIGWKEGDKIPDGCPR